MSAFVKNTEHDTWFNKNHLWVILTPEYRVLPRTGSRDFFAFAASRASGAGVLAARERFQRNLDGIHGVKQSVG